jgi:hypothetical protein
MLELIMVLSAVLGKYSDLAVVGALLVVNAVLSFLQELLRHGDKLVRLHSGGLRATGSPCRLFSR